MDRKSFRCLTAVFVVALVAALAQPASLLACSTTCCDPILKICTICTVQASVEEGAPVEPNTAVVTRIGPERALISISGYATTLMTAASICPAALSPVEGIQKVNSIHLVDSTTGQVIDALRFTPSQGASEGYARYAAERGLTEAQGGPWFGFRAQASHDVPDGIRAHFVVDVTLAPGTDFASFVEAVRRSAILGSGAGLPDGTPDGGHLTFQPLAWDDVFAAFPNPNRPLAPRLQSDR